MKTVITFGKPQLNRLVLVSFITLLCTSHVFGVTTYTWNGNTSSDWNTAANWTASSGPSAVPTATDIVKIGTAAFGSQPVIGTLPAAVAASITFGTVQTSTLTVNSGYILTVSGAITQNAAAFNNNVTFITTLAGNGSIKCASLTVGDNTTVPIASKCLLQMVSTIANLHVTGSVTVNSTSTSILIIGVGLINANFSLQGGTMQIDGTISTVNTKVGILPLVSASPTFRIDINSALSPILQLNNTAPLNTSSVSGSIDFYNNTGGTGTSTVYYNGASQTVYANQTACLDNSPQTYQNLILTSTGTATVGTIAGCTLTVGNDFTTSAATTNLSAYNPTVTIGDDWVNTGNVTGGSGNITVTNLLQDNSNTITLAGGATTIGVSGIQMNGGNIIAGAGTLTDNGLFQNNGGLLNCGTAANAKVIFKSSYTNNSGTFTANPTSTSAVYFSGASQALQDNTTTGTTFNNVIFNGSGTAVMSSGTGNFKVAATGTLTMTSGTLTAGTNTTTTAAAVGYLTLLSTATSTATVASMTAGSITGAVNVQRYVTGGTGYRGYRLFSSPTNISNLTNQNGTTTAYEAFIDPTYLNSGMLTGGKGTGFDVTTTNPLMYLYDESRASSYVQFYSGKNVGIYSITGLTSPSANSYKVVPLSITNAQLTAVQVPVGNSFLDYFVGTTSLSNHSPEAAVVTATGYLNQGTIRMWLFKTSGTNVQTLSNSGGGTTPGLNQVGNPYASTILLDKLYSDNHSSPYNSTINPTFWELDPTTGLSGTYISYNASTHTTSTTKRSCNFIVSGQGFLVQAAGASPTLTFLEDQKTSYPAITDSTITTSTTTGTLLMDIPTIASVSNADVPTQSFAQNNTVAPAASDSTATTAPALNGLHLQLSKDSTAYTQTGIYFSSKWTDTYNPMDDAIDLDGANPKVYLSSFSSDGQRLSINQLADYKSGKRIKLYAAAVSTGSYNISLADIINIDTASNNIFLVDKTLNDSLDMVHKKSYAFNINTADTTTYGANRFVLAIEPKLISSDQHLPSFQAKANTPNGNLIIYPNPSKSIINISLAKNASGNYFADIYNTSGILIKHESLNTDTWTEDISNYKLGVYFIELKDTNGYQLGEAKFVKTN